MATVPGLSSSSMVRSGTSLKAIPFGVQCALEALLVVPQESQGTVGAIAEAERLDVDALLGNHVGHSGKLARAVGGFNDEALHR